MEPFAALMRRYCIDYTSAHDQSVTADLMRDDYEVVMSGRTLGMRTYTDAVTAAFRRYPTLTLTVHEMILSGDRLAMRFSEHGAAAEDPDSVAVWPGISLYDWDGEKLTRCRVEQDFQGRDEQAAGGFTTALEPGHPDPWATTTDQPPDRGTEAALRSWLDGLAAEPVVVLQEPAVRLLETGDGPAVLDGLSSSRTDLTAPSRSPPTRTSLPAAKPPTSSPRSNAATWRALDPVRAAVPLIATSTPATSAAAIRMKVPALSALRSVAMRVRSGWKEGGD